VRSGVWFTLVLSLIAATFLVAALPLSPPSRVAPLWVLLPTAAMTGAQLVVDLRSAPATAVAGDRMRRRKVRIALWILALAALVYLFGFLLGAGTFLLFYVRAESGAGWGRALIVAVTTVASIYVTFELIAGMRLPVGAVF
jgi:hypothetical protein